MRFVLKQHPIATTRCYRRLGNIHRRGGDGLHHRKAIWNLLVEVERLPAKLEEDTFVVDTERQQTSRGLLVTAEQAPAML